MNSYCLACDKKLRVTSIKEDNEYNGWKRKYHKKCWNESGTYHEI